MDLHRASWINDVHGSSLLHGNFVDALFAAGFSPSRQVVFRVPNGALDKEAAFESRLWQTMTLQTSPQFHHVLCNPLRCNSNDQLLTANRSLAYTILTAPRKELMVLARTWLQGCCFYHYVCATFFQMSTCYASPIPVVRRTCSILGILYSTLSLSLCVISLKPAKRHATKKEEPPTRENREAFSAHLLLNNAVICNHVLVFIMRKSFCTHCTSSWQTFESPVL